MSWFAKGDKFLVNDDGIDPSKPPPNDTFFHSFTYIPDAKTLEKNSVADWVGDSHEKPLKTGDIFKAKITNFVGLDGKVDPKGTTTIDLPKCQFIHVIFYNSEMTIEDKTHMDIAITFDILFDDENDKKQFLTTNSPLKFHYLSFGISVGGGMSGSKIVQEYKALSEGSVGEDGTVKSLRVNDLVISADKSTFGGLKRDDAFIGSLIQHHIDTGKPAAGSGVTGTDVDKSLSAAGQSLSNAINKTGGKSIQKRKTYRKRLINKKKRRKSRRHRKKL